MNKNMQQQFDKCAYIYDNKMPAEYPDSILKCKSCFLYEHIEDINEENICINCEQNIAEQKKNLIEDYYIPECDFN